MTATNAKFAITTQSGRSIVKEFTSYAEAQKYADRHFGKGSIVQMVGNSVACNSTNPVVRKAMNALGLSIETVERFVKEWKPSAKTERSGRDMKLYDVGYGSREHLALKAALKREFGSYFNWLDFERGSDGTLIITCG